MFLASNFALSDAEDNIHFWEEMSPFALLVHTSLTASRTLSQQLLACLNFTLDSEDLFCWYKQTKKKKLWTMAAAQAAEQHEDEWNNAADCNTEILRHAISFTL